MRRAEELRTSGEIDAAIRCFQELTRTAETAARAHYGMGLCFREKFTMSGRCIDIAIRNMWLALQQEATTEVHNAVRLDLASDLESIGHWEDALVQLAAFRRNGGRHPELQSSIERLQILLREEREGSRPRRVPYVPPHTTMFPPNPQEVRAQQQGREKRLRDLLNALRAGALPARVGFCEAGWERLMGAPQPEQARVTLEFPSHDLTVTAHTLPPESTRWQSELRFCGRLWGETVKVKGQAIWFKVRLNLDSGQAQAELDLRPIG